MATTPTQLPVPSEKPQDLKFNSGKIDEFVTSMGWTYTDRLGGKHYTIEGNNYLARLAISAFGYITMDSFEDGNTLTLVNQVLRRELTGDYYRWDGELPKRVDPGSSPESSGGIGVGAWLSVGDAVLRSNLLDNNGYTNIGLCPNIVTLLSIDQRNSIIVSKYFDDGCDISSRYVWKIGVAKSKHNGGSIISPTVPWDGSRATLPAFLAGTGETQPLANGCWVLGSFPIAINFGADGVLDDTASIRAYVKSIAGKKATFTRTANNYKLSGDVIVYSGTTMSSLGAVFDFIPGSTYFDFFRNYAATVDDDSVRDYDIKFTGLWNLNGGFRYLQADAKGTGPLNPYSKMAIVAGVRLVKVDGVSIEGLVSKYSGYGLELKSCRNYNVSNCTFNENGDDGFSNSDGEFQSTQSHNGLIESCSAQSNGFAWLGNGSSGFEVDDGPTNITLFKCSAQNNNGRGFDVHTHSGKNANISGISYIECVASANNYPTDWPNPAEFSSNFGFGISFAEGGRINGVSYERCRSLGHKYREFALYGRKTTGEINSGKVSLNGCEINGASLSLTGSCSVVVSGFEVYEHGGGAITTPDAYHAIAIDSTIKKVIGGITSNGGRRFVSDTGSITTLNAVMSLLNVKDNTVSSLAPSLSDDVIFSAGSYSVDIQDNVIDIAPRRGSVISLTNNADTYARIVKINDNNIKTNSTTRNGTGISINRADFLQVMGNQVQDMATGVHFGTVNAAVYTGNIITNTTTPRTGTPTAFQNANNIESSV